MTCERGRRGRRGCSCYDSNCHSCYHNKHSAERRSTATSSNTCRRHLTCGAPALHHAPRSLLCTTLMVLALLGLYGASAQEAQVAVNLVCTAGSCANVSQPVILNTPTRVGFGVVQVPTDTSTAAQQVADENNLMRRAFVCSLDGGPYTACAANPDGPGALQEYAPVGRLADGQHQFCARAVLPDAQQVSSDACPSQCGAITCLSFVIDTQAPELTAPSIQFGVRDRPPFPTTWQTSEDFLAAFNDYIVQNNGPPFRASRFPATQTNTTLIQATLVQQDASASPSALSADLWRIECRLTNTPASGSTAATDDGPFQPCTGAANAGDGGAAGGVGGAWLTSYVTNSSLAVMVSTPIPAPNTVNSHTLHVRGIDAAGNKGPVVSAVWSVDTQPPIVTVASDRLFDSGTGYSSIPAGQFHFSAQDPAPVPAHPAAAQPYCRIAYDATAAAPPQASPQRLQPPFQPCASPWSFDVSPLLTNASGAFVFQVRAVDAAGNTATTAFCDSSAVPATDGASAACVQHAFHIATRPPQLSVSIHIPNVTAAFHSLEHFSYACRGVLVATDTCVFASSSFDARVHLTSTALDGLVSFECQLDDQTWFPCFPQPSTITNTNTNTSSTDATAVVVDPVFANTGARFRIATSAQQESFAGLPDAGHVFRVRAHSVHGLSSDVTTFRWTTDTTVLPASITNAPPPVTTRTWAAFAFDTSSADTESFVCSVDGQHVPCTNGTLYLGADASPMTNATTTAPPDDGGTSTAAPPQAMAPVRGWTAWTNNHSPDDPAVDGGGDTETVACALGQALWAVECRAVCPAAMPGCEQLPAQDTLQTFESPCATVVAAAGEARVGEQARVQLRCRHADQSDGRPCLDYEMRAWCGAPTNATRVVASARDTATLYVDGQEYVGVRAVDGPRIVDIPAATRVLAIAARTGGDALSGRIRISLPFMDVFSDASWMCSHDTRWLTDLSWTAPEFDPSATTDASFSPARVVTQPLRADVDAWLSQGHSDGAQWIWTTAPPSVAPSDLQLHAFCRRVLSDDASSANTGGDSSNTASQGDDGDGSSSMKPLPLSGGTHELLVYAVDRVGNLQQPPTRFLWRVDTDRPTVKVTMGPSPGNGYAVHAAFGADEIPFDTGQGFAFVPALEVEVDGQLLPDVYCIEPSLSCAGATCRILSACTTNATSAACHAQRQALGCATTRTLPLAFATTHGPHALAMRARDPADNLGAWMRLTYSVDAAAPAPAVIVPATPKEAMDNNTSSAPLALAVSTDDGVQVLTREPSTLLLDVRTPMSDALFFECVQSYECLLRTPGTGTTTTTTTTATTTGFEACGPPVPPACTIDVAATIAVQGPAVRSLLLRLLHNCTTNDDCAFLGHAKSSQSSSITATPSAAAPLPISTDAAIQAALAIHVRSELASSGAGALLGVRIGGDAPPSLLLLPEIRAHQTAAAFSQDGGRQFGAAEAAFVEAVSAAAAAAQEGGTQTQQRRCKVSGVAAAQNGNAEGVGSSITSLDLLACAATPTNCLWSCAGQLRDHAGSNGGWNSTHANCTMSLPLTPGAAAVQCGSTGGAALPTNATTATLYSLSTAAAGEGYPPWLAGVNPTLLLPVTLTLNQTQSYPQHLARLAAVSRALNSEGLRVAIEEGIVDGDGADQHAQETAAAAHTLVAMHVQASLLPPMDTASIRPTAAVEWLVQNATLLSDAVVAKLVPHCNLVGTAPSHWPDALVLLLTSSDVASCSQHAREAAQRTANTTLLMHLSTTDGTVAQVPLALHTTGAEDIDVSSAVRADADGASSVLAALGWAGVAAAPIPVRVYHRNACPATNPQAAHAGNPPLCVPKEDGGVQQELLVRAVDAAGQRGDAAQLQLYWDTTPPSLVWNARPLRAVTTGDASQPTTVTFDFALLDPLPRTVQQRVAATGITATFSCALTEVAAAQASSASAPAVPRELLQACTPPMSYRVVDGAYAFAVVPTDELGNVGQTSVYTFTVSTAPPALSAAPLPAAVYQYPQDIPHLTVNVAAEVETAAQTGSSPADGLSLRCVLWWRPCDCVETCVQAPHGADAAMRVTQHLAPALDAPCTSPISIATLLTAANPPLSSSGLPSGLFPVWIALNVSLADDAGTDATGAAPVSYYAVIAPDAPVVSFAATSLPPLNTPSVAAEQWIVFGARQHGVPLPVTAYECQVVTLPASLLKAQGVAAPFRVHTRAEALHMRHFVSGQAKAKAEALVAAAPWFRCTSPINVDTRARGLHVFAVRAVYRRAEEVRTAESVVAWLGVALTRPHVDVLTAEDAGDIAAAAAAAAAGFDTQLGQYSADVSLEQSDEATSAVGPKSCALRLSVVLSHDPETLRFDRTRFLSSAACTNHSVRVVCSVLKPTEHDQVLVDARLPLPSNQRQQQQQEQHAVWGAGGALVSAEARRLLLRGQCRAVLRFRGDDGVDAGPTVLAASPLDFERVRLFRISGASSDVTHSLGLRCCVGGACSASTCTACGGGVCAYDCGAFAAGAAASPQLVHSQSCDCELAADVESCWPGLRATSTRLLDDSAAAVFAAWYEDGAEGRGPAATAVWNVTAAERGRTQRFGLFTISYDLPEKVVVAGATANDGDGSAAAAYDAAVAAGTRDGTLPLGYEQQSTVWMNITTSVAIVRVQSPASLLENDAAHDSEDNVVTASFVVHAIAAAASSLTCTAESVTRVFTCTTAAAAGSEGIDACTSLVTFGPPNMLSFLGRFERVCFGANATDCPHVNGRAVYAFSRSSSRLLYFDTTGWVLVHSANARALQDGRSAPRSSVLLRSADDAASVAAIQQPWRFPDNREATAFSIACETQVLVHAQVRAASVADLAEAAAADDLKLCIQSHISAPPRASPPACADVSAAIQAALTNSTRPTTPAAAAGSSASGSAGFEVACPATNDSALAAVAIILYLAFTVLLSLSIYYTRKREATAIAAKHLRRAVLLNSEGLELSNVEDFLTHSDESDDNDDGDDDDDEEQGELEAAEE
ncbi:hypothetical protein PTSG_00537 [Salpingoeca rosetta]|uniref:WxxW domain-containing protein n=1 Tax=Salpingoeca rosetta (strain ATCC 50818 / BSB-021) TaxID=946362 RepID=F2TWS0_SALR5|nr:uncharacterized protein PTSG_00537 [Salpingoeca rosetta]EGD72516.1 hypothetical protein PTSG_00537 [Salpingoeca rosetta]|eukprot:XP_004999085.1 hypothetical protein PTSG_00537 [Salpingoeca rosetta]